VSTDRLRAWERRDGLLRPVRTPGRFRLDSREDEQRRRGRERRAGPHRRLRAGATGAGRLRTGRAAQLGLTGFAISLRNRGWRITYLGADTPIAMTARAARREGRRAGDEVWIALDDILQQRRPSAQVGTVDTQVSLSQRRGTRSDARTTGSLSAPEIVPVAPA
jgi:hypothetical protein